MPDVPPALLVEQARLAPMLDRLLALAALWADPPAQWQNGTPSGFAAADHVAVRAAPQEAAGKADRDTIAGMEPVGMVASPDGAVPVAPLPRRAPPGVPGPAEPILPTVVQGGTVRPGAPRVVRTDGMSKAMPGIAPPPPTWPTARLPMPRGQAPRALEPQPSRSPFAALAPAAAQAAPLAGAAAPNTAIPAPAGVLAGTLGWGPRPGSVAAPDGMVDDKASSQSLAAGLARRAAPSPSGAGAVSGFFESGAGSTTAINPESLPGDVLEERLADLLECAALEAGVAMP